MVPIVRGPDGALALGDTHDPALPVVDWVLRMARVPAADFLDAIAAAGRLTPACSMHWAMRSPRTIKPAAAPTLCRGQARVEQTPDPVDAVDRRKRCAT